MRPFLAAGAALTALGLAAAAQAQPQDDTYSHAPPPRTQPAPAPTPAPRTAAPVYSNRPQPNAQSGAPQNGAQRGNWGDWGGQPQNRNAYQRAPGAQRGYDQNGYGSGYPRGGYAGQYQGRAGFSGYQRQYYAQQRFRLAPRYYPQGWYARNWAYGEYLPWGWFAPQFYLSWNDYGLPAPPPGAEWVQEGPDAVLVDIASGEVISVVRGAFYW